MATEASHLSGSRVTSQIVLNMLFMMASLLIFVILHVGYLRDLSLDPRLNQCIKANNFKEVATYSRA